MAMSAGTLPRVEEQESEATGRHLPVTLYTGLLLLVLAALLVWNKPLWVLDKVTAARLAVAGMRGHDVMIDGHRIHYLEGGEGSPVLLVHGLGSRASDWSGLIPSLVKSSHHVYAIDLLGYGNSDKPKDANFSIGDEATLVEHFIDTEHLQQVDLAGWSMGGWISMVVATEMPERIAKLVLLDSAGLRFQPTFDPLLFTPSNLDELHSLMTLLTPDMRPVPTFFAKALLMRSKEDSWVIRRSVTSMLTGQNLLDGKLDKLTMPVLIVWGKQDVLTPLSMAYAIHAGVPHSTLELFDGCGHLAPGLCASRIAPKMTSFLDNSDTREHATVVLPSGQ